MTFVKLLMLSILTLVFALAGPLAAAESDKAVRKLALVIGNKSYEKLPALKNSVADAELISGALRQVGFDVTLLTNADKTAMGRAMVDFRNRIQPDDIIVIYFAGHGIQANEENYLVPVDAALSSVEDLPWFAIAANEVVRQFEASQAGSLIFILDACRDNPFWSGQAKTRSAAGGATRGLARIASNKTGTLIAFSTSPGAVAQDGSGVNSPYTEALAETLVEPGQSIETVFKRARVKVVKATEGKQLPWENSSLITDIVLQPRAGEPTIIEASPCDLAAAHPSDPERIGPSVDYANLDPNIAIPACEAAVKQDPSNMRFKTLLARALDKAGRGEEARDLNEIAMKAGSLAAYHNMGNLYRKGLGVEKDISKAFELYLYAAERGHVEDMSNVGFMYMQGQGVKQDYALAMKWLSAAADENWSSALDKIGLLYLKGLGTKADIARAIDYFQRGTNVGDRSSMVNLATLYMKGTGVKKDNVVARDLFSRAARLGAVAAYINLGNIYAEGKSGIKADPMEAAFWYTLASREGREEALAQLKGILSGLSEDDRQQLDERLDDWSRQKFG
ncbi:caspase family protein (plasmid) [Rhizobium sp. 32-5/1]|uniref:caspase family protein n=1 Tax=Rhizobium sp. 32-5/1 TaxID=3019602 RepID=UPI00240DAE4F|nr:caspase family protein [Rhizobium sp. 32-5/1]WEZ85878.1 caspase family protein [Rhizobium sp. 32-5/1]